MKKIEKLEIPDTNAVIGLADRDGKEIEIKAIGRKINEIIDYLNQSQKEPEKQEEWREEWRKLSFEIGSITKQQADEIEDFISQLLSEKTKEAREEEKIRVLEKLEKWSTNPQWGVFYDVGCNCQERLLRFLSKLLKEKIVMPDGRELYSIFSELEN